MGKRSVRVDLDFACTSQGMALEGKAASRIRYSQIIVSWTGSVHSLHRSIGCSDGISADYANFSVRLAAVILHVGTYESLKDQYVADSCTVKDCSILFVGNRCLCNQWLGCF